MYILTLLILTYLFVSCWFNWRIWCAFKGYQNTRVLICLFLVPILTFALPIVYKLPSNNFLMSSLAYLGSLWLAFFLYALLILLCVDIFRLLNRFFNWFPRLKGGNSPKLPFYTCLSIASIAGLICLIGWINAGSPIVRHLEINAHADIKKPQTIKIVALSDLHLGRLVSAQRLDQMVDMILPLEPDVVLFAGDVLDDHVDLDKPAMKNSIARINAPLGVWGILGNHEYISGPVDDSLQIINDMGIAVLRDSWSTPNDQLLIVGRDDYSSKRFNETERLSLDSILATIPEKKRQLPMILLDHQPYNLEQAEQAGTLLQISGHTHNGQLWPINYIVDALYEVSSGYGQRAQTHYWVSVGVGTWGPPVRTNSRPEVVSIKLNLMPLEK